MSYKFILDLIFGSNNIVSHIIHYYKDIKDIVTKKKNIFTF